MIPTDERDLVINKESGRQQYWFTLRKKQFYPILGKNQQGYLP